MHTSIKALVSLLALSLSLAASAAGAQGPLGAVVGNTLVADYGDKGVITGDFNADGTVQIVFPDGHTSQQQWLADDKNFCMMEMTAAGTPFTYHCERNLLAGKKVGDSWKQTDSDGTPATMTIKPRAR
ncbi:hypothetical protein [Dyella sp.]|jgi:hypothetical protein|uniref:hypothetical protein n=1 Tax=Dyella sp. TaxID=1869338 RepID=UPI002D788CB5|nr:hypothetical protein [Dyella sp.]HET6431755.1 hypothetical protein [Dyella sp.]